MDTIIRKATENDFEEVYSLINDFAVFIKTPEKVSITPEQMKLDKDYFQCLVAVQSGKIIGFATYFFAYYSWTGKALYLDDLYVVEEYRGQKTGTMLMDAVFEIARNESCTKVRWQISNWNSKAIEFYKKRGAVVDGVEINCDLKLLPK
ncbi:MAG: GNAT family N-acetyltransferase [Ignavibacteriae bacterium]|nr:GNAT family N-acetyltransferase [Ignavibacteriota bacterium]